MPNKYIIRLKQQHLQGEPPLLTIANSRLHSLILMMLRKNPETRPSLERVKNLLEQMQSSSNQSQSSGFSTLSSVAVEILDQSAKEDAKRRTELDEQNNREQIAREAMGILLDIIDSLFERITSFAPNAHVSPGYSKVSYYPNIPERTITFGPAKLIVNFSRFAKVSKEAFSSSKWDVYTGAIIKVKQETTKPYEWGANLWYTDLGKGVELRWWEVTYMSSFVSHRPRYEPYAVDDVSVADRAVSPVMDIIQLGARPKLVDDEAVDEFCDRWAKLLAKAAKGELEYPRSLPLD